MKHRRADVLAGSAWLLALIISLTAVIAWGSSFAWRVWPPDNYVVFPLLGVLAFGLMWSHYTLGTVRDLTLTPQAALKSYYQWTGYAVLILICLHPGLLIYQRFRDGAGLPPGSYLSYVMPSLKWVTLLGTVSLLVFLAFELHRVYGERKWFQYVRDASDPAMLAIAYHGLQLGITLQQTWFRYVWYFYALSLIAVLMRKYWLRYQGWRSGQMQKPGQ